MVMRPFGGEWEVRVDSPERIFVHSGNATIAICRDGDWIVTQEQAVANARLIAASKKLLEALEKCTTEMDKMRLSKEAQAAYLLGRDVLNELSTIRR